MSHREQQLLAKSNWIIRNKGCNRANLNSVESHHNRMKEAEERISELEDISCQWGSNQNTGSGAVSSLNRSIQELRDIIKRLNIRVMGIPEGAERS